MDQDRLITLPHDDRHQGEEEGEIDEGLLGELKCKAIAAKESAYCMCLFLWFVFMVGVGVSIVDFFLFGMGMV